MNLSKAIIYVRVSSTPQADSLNGNVSLETQEMVCRDYCKEHNLSVDQVISETSSARDLKKLKKLNNLVKSLNGRTLVIHSVSRLARNTRDAMNLCYLPNGRYINLVSVTEPFSLNDPNGFDIFVNLCSKAQLFSDNLSKRIKESYDFRKRLGSFSGTAPYGSKVVSELRKIGQDKEYTHRSLIEEPEEQRVIRFVRIYLSPESSSSIIRRSFYEDLKRIPDPKTNFGPDRDINSLVEILNENNLTNRGTLWKRQTFSRMCSKAGIDYGAIQRNSKMTKILLKQSRKRTREDSDDESSSIVSKKRKRAPSIKGTHIMITRGKAPLIPPPASSSSSIQVDSDSDSEGEHLIESFGCKFSFE